MIDAMTKHLIRRLRANRGQEDGDPDRAARKSSSTSSTSTNRRYGCCWAAMPSRARPT
jgi:hypothetical protein